MWLGSGVLGVEGEIALTPGYFQGDKGLVQSSRVTNRAWKRRARRTPQPHAGVAAAVRVGRLGPDASDCEHPSDVEGLGYSRNLTAFNMGGGVIGMLSRRTGLRWDVRYLRGIGSAEGGGTLNGGAKLTYWRASMAVVIRTR